jgi:multidrug resistance protein, MATE family
VLAWALADGHFGAPAMGAVGAASATTIASWLGLGMIGLACWTLPDAGQRQVRDLSVAAWRRALADLPALARFGFVPALAASLELFGFAILIALSTRLGAVTAGAFQAVFSLHNLSFSIGLGMGSAAGVRVGNAVGAGEAHLARQRTTIAMLIAVVMMATLATAYLLFAHPVVSIFSADPEVTAAGAMLLAGLAFFIPFDGIQVVYMNGLRSLGDQVAAGINGIIAYFIVTGGLGWLLVLGGFGARALVIAAGIGMIAAAALQAGRFLLVTRRLSAPAFPQSSG